MKVLVLGATGYIGSAVAGRLAEHGHEVVALIRPRPGEVRSVPGAAEVRHGDVTDPASLAAAAADVDAVVHAVARRGRRRWRRRRSTPCWPAGRRSSTPAASGCSAPAPRMRRAR
ncbi:NAD-dependent epimerase/dehydratase family protein [Planomonospora algeriensis]